MLGLSSRSRLPIALLISLTASIILALFLTSCLDTRADQRLAPELETLAKEVIADNNCGRCHALQARGLNLTGKVGPNLTREARRNRSPEWLRKQLTDPTSINAAEVLPHYRGKQHLMPSFEHLTQQELTALVEFLRTLR